MGPDRYDAIVVGARCAGSPTAMLLATQGASCARRRSGDVPERHPVDPHPPPARGRGHAAVGPAATGSSPAAVRRSTRTRSTSAPSRSPAPRARRSHRWRTARAGPSSTRSWWTAHPKPVPRSARGSPSRRSSSRTDGSSGSAAAAPTGRTSPNVHRSSSAPTAATRPSPRRSIPSSTTRSRRSCAATTPIGAGSPMDDRFEVYIRPDRGFGVAPTNDGLTLVVAGWPIAEFDANKGDVEGQLPQGARAGPRVRRPHAGRQAGGEVRRDVRRELLPQAVRPRAGPWSGTPGTTRTSSRRWASPTRSVTPSSVRDRARRRLDRDPVLRRRDG